MPRSVRADRLALAHTVTGNDRLTRAKTVEVRINSNQVLGRMTLHRDDYRKTIWPFPDGSESVRSLELRVLDRHVQGRRASASRRSNSGSGTSDAARQRDRTPPEGAPWSHSSASASSPASHPPSGT
jgi:hypothetical protein